MENLDNPFLVGKYVPDEYFCDRVKETNFLVKQIVNGRNVVLASARRIGKTGLISHCFSQPGIMDKYYTFYIDIYTTTCLSDFVCQVGAAIYQQLKPRKTVWAERFFSFIGSLRFGFKLDTVTGEPTFNVSVGQIASPQTTLDEIFEYLENADKPCVVAIDEFQQIGGYEEKNVEALLRTKIQQCRTTQFIFSGSRRHVMNNMFNSPARPFYQSAISMGLEAIPLDAYTEFAVGLFRRRNKSVSEEVVEKVYREFEGCTWFLQVMMNELFALTPEGGSCGEEKFGVALENVICVQEWNYKDTLARLPLVQKQVLLAVAKEGRVTGITSSEFVGKYGLKSPSSVQSAVRALLEKDLITQDAGMFRVSDYFFAEWIRISF